MDVHKKPIYPVEPWTVTEERFEIENNYRNETTFALSNGYIGTRGTFEESYAFDTDTGLEGNFINGFYESEDIRYGEANFGSPLKSQTLLNLPNLKTIRLLVDGERLDMREGRLLSYRRSLDMKAGVLTRELVWESPGGRQVSVCIRRLVSFCSKNIMEISYCARPLNFSGELAFCSGLQANVENHTQKTNPIVDYGPFGRKLEPVNMEAGKWPDQSAGDLYYEGRTQGSGLTVACGAVHTLYAGKKKQTTGARVEIQREELELWAHIACQVKAGDSVTLEKFICYASDLDMASDQLSAFTRDQLEIARNDGFAAKMQAQAAYMEQFWENSDVKIQGEEALQQGIRFNLFHIMQAAGRDGRTGMGAKGLSGEGYEGHYFWDTEMYVLPVFVCTAPQLAKKLLDYRYGALDKARDRARILGHQKGALFPWRTINGEEASTYYPLGTAQYHINGDIAYALQLYIDGTGDREYLRDKGAELFIETARVWADVGSFAECRDGKYCICCVTGPDEYNVLVDNNFYTNLIARENLRSAVRAVDYMRQNEPQAWEELAARIGFDQAETELWERIIARMYFPYDEKRGIFPLDDGFMMRKPWDESRIPPEKRAWLYENYHPLFIMRHRMSKQADCILGLYLYGHLFSEEEIRRNYDFYQEVTLHHSSLSTCIFGIVACQIGCYDEAFRYFTQSARMDLDDYHNNFYAGIHAANMAGTWQAIVNGFAGLRINNGELSFKPYLPETWQGYEFKINFRGNVLRVKIDREGVEYGLLKGKGLAFYTGKRRVTLEREGDCCHEKI